MGAQRHTVDFDLHGLVGIRVVDATPSDVDAVRRQLGPIQGPLAGAPDIIIRFVERLPLSGPLRYVGLEDAGFSDDSFFILRGKHKSRVRVRVPLDAVGERFEIVCESGCSAVPLLIALINLTVLGRGVLPLHAAAFNYEGAGVLVTGWSKGGKTECLLAFMQRGAHYVGDEWVYVDPDGRRLFGISEPIKLWDWHLNELPEYRARLARDDRARLRALGRARNATAAASRRLAGRSSTLTGRALHLLDGQLYTNVTPERLFGVDRCDYAGRLDKVFLVMSAEAPGVRVENIDADEIAQRMSYSLAHERLELHAAYLKFRFAFPGAAGSLIDDAHQIERELLGRALAGTDAYVVYHPYPAPIPMLFEAMAPHL